MSKFIVNIVDSITRNVLETLDQEFSNEREAEEYACDCSGAFAKGAEELSLAGRDYVDPDDVDFVVEEVEDA